MWCNMPFGMEDKKSFHKANTICQVFNAAVCKALVRWLLDGDWRDMHVVHKLPTHHFIGSLGIIRVNLKGPWGRLEGVSIYGLLLHLVKKKRHSYERPSVFHLLQFTDTWSIPVKCRNLTANLQFLQYPPKTTVRACQSPDKSAILGQPLWSYTLQFRETVEEVYTTMFLQGQSAAKTHTYLHSLSVVKYCDFITRLITGISLKDLLYLLENISSNLTKKWSY